uniref:zinc-binding dehydrogenase n=1 Tax=Alicyclobacillus mali (ex Roth et al. 2021) TaxID=1123961 RepID=UPI001A90BEB3
SNPHRSGCRVVYRPFTRTTQGKTRCLGVRNLSFEQAYRCLRPGGTVVFVALPADNYVQIPIFETVLNAIHIQGSIVGTRLDLAEVFDIHASGLTKVIYERRRLDEVNECFHEVESGAAKARIVFEV